MQEPWNSIVIAVCIFVLLLVFVLVLDHRGLIVVRPVLGSWP